MLGKDPSRRGAELRRTPRWLRPAVLASSAVRAPRVELFVEFVSVGFNNHHAGFDHHHFGFRVSAAAIRTLQAALSKVGCYTGEVDGVGGPLTTAAVRSFQAAEGLAVDGVYGSSTKSKLATAVAAGTRVCASSTTTTSSAVTTTTAASAAPAAATAAINA